MPSWSGEPSSSERSRACCRSTIGREVETGDTCGIYIFDSESSLQAFRQTELARTIPSAYQVESPRIEVFELLFPCIPTSVSSNPQRHKEGEAGASPSLDPLASAG